MDETVISVQGSASAWHEAERATVSISVAHDGPKREPVFAAATAAADRVTAALRELHNPDSGPVTRWSSDRVSVWSERPWNADGKQLADMSSVATRKSVDDVKNGKMASATESSLGSSASITRWAQATSGSRYCETTRCSHTAANSSPELSNLWLIAV